MLLRRPVSRIAAVLVAVCSLSACQTVHLGDREFIKPDRVVGTMARAPISASWVQARWPDAQLREEALPTSEGGSAAVLHGISVDRPDAMATVLFFGGNLFRIDDAGAQVLEALAACPVNVVMFDYRGYGRSSGAPSVAALAADAVQVYDHVRAKVKGPLLVHGYSLGSFMAARVASQRPVDGLVLAGTAPSPRAAAEQLVRQRAGLAAPLIRLQLSEGLEGVDNLSALGRFQGPSLVLAGGRDQTTPEALGRKVFDAIPSTDKRFIVEASAGHAALLPRGSFAKPYCDLVQRVAQPALKRQANG